MSAVLHIGFRMYECLYLEMAEESFHAILCIELKFNSKYIKRCFIIYKQCTGQCKIGQFLIKFKFLSEFLCVI